ncbi:hypothetical protein GPECTOR_24g283 [Gonium pectorale]|uniref:Uncharacterized protein n=1 Tax=Gonium pectorale TaxID=33097 RepID=A0A150GGT1_GONPE|nr:hypothetical protein GPECTOR_24g283 [Gonium pectorale]|eukprot:KXZ48993.1 hypothetical protein GPECTOR_24g283 [Gonium pectorale]
MLNAPLPRKRLVLLEVCPVLFPLQDVNKGFESLVVFRRGGERHMLGLCESNYCKTITGDDPPGLQRGNGRLVWATYRPAGRQEEEHCTWEVQKVIKLPEDAYLLDYSAISFRGDFGSDVAVVSQEDAAVWVGTFDWQEMEFVRGEEDRPAGRIYHFPRTADCSKQYCNVEGVSWIDAERLVLASDKCMDKDQAVHIMALP